MDFKDQVSSLTGLSISGSGTTPTEDELSQFLTDGAKDVINKFIIIMPGEAYKFSTTESLSDDAGLFVKGSILSIVRENNNPEDLRECTPIDPSHRTSSKEKTSLHYRSTSNPGYYKMNGKVFVVPVPTAPNNAASVTHILYPEVLHDESSIGSSTVINTKSGVLISRVVDESTEANTKSVFTKTAHGFVEGDLVKITDCSEATDLNGITGTVKYIDSGSFELYGIFAQPIAEATGAVITTVPKIDDSWFPDEYEYLIVLYAAIKSVEAKLASYTVEDEDLELVRGYANTLATLKNQYLSSFGIKAEAKVGGSDEELNR